jgi:hypothetical protein
MLMVANLVAQRLYLLVGGKGGRHSQDYKERPGGLLRENGVKVA